MDHKEFLANTRRVLSIIHHNIDGSSCKEASLRNRSSGALFDISDEHAEAIVILLEEKYYASAYALVRPMLETFIRASWIQHCATDDEIEKTMEKDKFDLTLRQMLTCVEEKRQWEKTLTRCLDSALNTMHGYTHGGTQIIARRLKNGYIEHTVDEQEIIEVLRLVNLIAFLSWEGIIGISFGYSKEHKALNDLLDDLCGWCFTKVV